MKTIQDLQSFLGVTADGIWGQKSQAALDAVLHPAAVDKTNVTERTDTGEKVDPRSEAAIATLHRKLQPIARQLVKLAADNDLTIKILSGTRTYAEQDALYHQGNVTKARGGYSNHNFGVAFDTGIFVNGKYIDDEYEKKRFSGAEMERLYTKLAVLGKSLGLSWGGDWKNFQDQPHFELHPPWAAHMEESQMLAELRRRHDNGIDAFA